MNDHNFSTLQKQLIKRFSPENICLQHFYIERMNPKLEISLSTFQNDPIIKNKNLTNQQLLKVLTSIDFFEKIKSSKQQKFRINYPNSKKVVLITGITVEFVQALVKEFDTQRHNRGGNDKIRKTNNFWISVEMSSPEYALMFKKIARSQKRICDLNQNSKYKLDKKRVRIVIQNEDFYTILVDAMNEQKAKKFNQSFGKECVDKVWYQRIQFNRGQTGQLGVSKQQQQEFDDNFSEEQSRTTEGLDGMSLKDCIETTDQGIQAQKIEQYMNLQYPNSPTRSRRDAKVAYSKGRQKKQRNKEQNFGTESIGSDISSDSQQNKNDMQIFKFKGHSKQCLKPAQGRVQSQITQNVQTKSAENKLEQIEQNSDQSRLNQYPNRQKIQITQAIAPKTYNANEKKIRKQQQNSTRLKIQQFLKQKRQDIEDKTVEQTGVGKKVNFFDTLGFQKNDSQRQFKYEYLHMKKLFHQVQKQRKQTKNANINIPTYLVKQCQHEKYHRYFLDGIWRSGRYGSKRNVLKRQII